MASSLPLPLLSSAPIKLSSVVILFEFKTTAIPMDFITLDVQPFPSVFVESSTRVVDINNLPSPPELHNGKRPPDLESRPGESYHLDTITSFKMAATTGRR